MFVLYLHRFRRSSALVVIILIAISSSSVFSQSQHLSFTQPNSEVIIPALDDFATSVLGDPWDMNEPTDLWGYRDTSGMINSTFSDGIYSAQMTGGNGAERIMLLTAGATDNAAMRVGKTGYTYPINANKYRYLSYRFYKSNENCNSALVMWYADDSRTPSVTGISNSYPACETPGAGWHTKIIDLATIGIQGGQKAWEGTIRELIIKPFAGPGAAGATFKLDWVRLTSEDPRGTKPFTTRWSGLQNSSVDLYVSEDQTLDDNDTLIASGVDSSRGSYTLDSGELFPGRYLIAAVTSSGITWSPGHLTINTPPQITFLSPSMVSGQDYAATELGNAWDMNDPSDLNDRLPSWWETCVGNETFAGGIYQARMIGCSNDNLFTDAKLLLGHMDPVGDSDPVIDTSKYRYFSFRFRLNGQQNIREGWVARLGWWQELNGRITRETVMSRDVMLVEGWNIYKVDLWANDVIDENHPVKRPWLNSAPNRLRFDPAELFTSRLPEELALDWIKLTAMDEVRRGSPYLIRYQTDSSRPATITFYYDTDTNPGNGRTRITTADASVPVSNIGASWSDTTSMVFLPAIANNGFNCDECVEWSTVGVAPGEYYICAEIDDEYNSTYSCSEAPVAVR